MASPDVFNGPWQTRNRSSSQRDGASLGAVALGALGTALGLVPIFFSIAWGLGLAAFVLGLVTHRRTGMLLGIASFAFGCGGWAIETGLVA
jgi:hypothetical protein